MEKINNKKIIEEREIIMEALKLAKAHTNWKTEKGSVWSFSRAKTRFVKLLRQALCEQKQETIREMIKLSDKSEHETKFNEWRAFKSFRNKMRDILKEL